MSLSRQWIKAGDEEIHPLAERASSYISSYMLKNALFWELYKERSNYLRLKHGSDDIDNAVFWMKRILFNLFEMLKDDKVPSYVCQTENQQFRRTKYEYFFNTPKQYEKPDTGEVTEQHVFVHLINVMVGNILNEDKTLSKRVVSLVGKVDDL